MNARARFILNLSTVIVPVILVAVLSIYYGFRAWGYLHQPVLLDIIPVNGVLEPVYASPVPEWLIGLFLVPQAFMQWWYSPTYFQIPYLLSCIWLAFWLYAHRPCIFAAREPLI